MELDFKSTAFHGKEIYTNVWTELHLEKQENPSIAMNCSQRFHAYKGEGRVNGNFTNQEDSLLPLEETIDLQDLESALSMEDVLTNLDLDMSNLGLDYSDMEIEVATSTPIDKVKGKQEQVPAVMSPIKKSDCMTPSDLLETDSGIADLAETTSSNKTPSDQGYTSSSDENVAVFPSDSCGCHVEVMPIYSRDDVGLWYSSSSDRESSTEGLQLLSSPVEMGYQIAGSRQRKPIKIRNRQKKALFLPNERLSESDDELIYRKNYRKKFTRQLWMDIKPRDGRDPHLEDRLCSKEEKKRKNRARKKEMRKLRQFFCKKELYRIVMF